MNSISWIMDHYNNRIMSEEAPLIPQGNDIEVNNYQATNHGEGTTQRSSPAMTSGFQRWSSCLLWMAVFSLLCLVVWQKQRNVQDVRNMSKELLLLRNRLDVIESQSDGKFYLVQDQLRQLQKQGDDRMRSLELNLNSQNITHSAQYEHLSQAIGEHDKALVRLSNGTSNADVLDKLKATKQEVYSALDSAKGEVSASLEATQRNVSVQLEESGRQLEATQSAVNAHLDDTVLTVKRVVSNATVHIHEVQRNVTGQLEDMSSKLSHTVKELTSSVQDAKDAIHEEVNVVQANIEQYVAITNKQFAAENDFVRYQIAGTFTLLSVLIFLFHMTSHARHYYKPDIQRRIMAVLWMVPVYSITSWVSLMKPTWEPFLAALRDLVEAYVVYTFVGLLVAVLSDGLSLEQVIDKLADHVTAEKKAVENYERMRSAGHKLIEKPKEHISPPCCCCFNRRDPVSKAKAWLWQCQLLAMQFVFVKPLSTFLPFLLEQFNVYDVDSVPPWQDQRVNWHSPKLYLIALQNLSVALAFSGLLSFFHGAEKDLEWCSPWPKFLCIKGVVFATFWQNICIQAMSAYGLVDEKAAAQIQNLLICIEMLIASIAHLYVFPYHEWAPNYQHEREMTILLKDTMALGDFYKDMRRLVTPWGVGNVKTDLSMLDQSRITDKGDMKEMEVGAEESLISFSHSKSSSLIERKGDIDDSLLLQEIRGELLERLNRLNPPPEQSPSDATPIPNDYSNFMTRSDEETCMDLREYHDASLESNLSSALPTRERTGSCFSVEEIKDSTASV